MAHYKINYVYGNGHIRNKMEQLNINILNKYIVA